jgi:predicted outer membrane protein
MKLTRHRAAYPAAAVLAGIAFVVPTSSVAAQAAKLDDPSIIAIFDAANTWDMETGALAAKKGRTKEVREFGAMLEGDHQTVRQQGRDLVKKLGVHPTPRGTSPWRRITRTR